jgi:starch phosphorylase
VLPEALEKWSVSLIGQLLPRHLELIYFVNFLFLEKVKSKFGSNSAQVERMSLVEEGPDKKIRMANLSIICSHSVNGVASIHTNLLRTTVFQDFFQMDRNKIQNKTNGVSPRRWIHCCNRDLSDLISRKIGSVDEWICDLDNLRQLSPYTQDPEFLTQFAEVKLKNKARLQQWVLKETGVNIPLHSLYDVQVKRIHEYKRQLLNIIYCVHRYLMIKDCPITERA